MITAGQVRAARALLGLDQRGLAELAGLSLPTIQRMEASDGVIRGNVDSLVKLIGALSAAGIELIGDGAVSPAGGRGVRLAPGPGNDRAMMPVAWAIPCLLLLSAAGIVTARSAFGRVLVYGGCLLLCSALAIGGFARPDRPEPAPPASHRPALDRHQSAARCPGRIFPDPDWPRRRRRQPVRPRLRAA